MHGDAIEIMSVGPSNGLFHCPLPGQGIMNNVGRGDVTRVCAVHV